MATEITMPKMGLTMTTRKVGRWLVPEGSPVKQGEALLEIMTDKITFAGKTKAEMEAVLREAAEHYRGSPSFRGFAIHHYTTWKAMKDE